MFIETPLVRRKRRHEAIAKWLCCGMTASLIIPLVLIIGYLVLRASPTLSFRFLVELPVRNMRAGGIWPALIGTVYLVVMSLAAADISRDARRCKSRRTIRPRQ